ncbi:MAG: ATPase domain-containing protein [Nitrososphaerota archaeon]|nr:AAA family ATPase [Candidatus Bathyarchaeota archaeon]MDW8022810.1 ATPase domain-containing protein [Nitrososphaerota archaeon]
MVEEKDVVEFLKIRRGEASLSEIAEGLGIPKYGPNSAYALLQSLKGKGVVERRGELWAVVKGEEAAKPPEKPVEVSAKVGPEGGVVTETVMQGVTADVEKLVRAMAQTLAEAMKGARVPADEWELATKPMTTEVEKREELKSLVLRADEAIEAKKPLIGFPTGTFIDHLFLTPEGKSLGGIPICGQFAITGLPGAGKSILVEEIAVRVAASGRKVLYVTAEDTWKSATPRFDLQSRMKQKADILGLDWNKVRENLFVMDTVAYPELRDWNTFAETYRYVAEKEKIELVIIDSVTVLEAYRGALKYRVMELARYNQVHGITALYVNQRSSEVWDSYDMAGGIGLAHNLDGTIIVDYGRVYWYDQQVDLKADRGEFVRIARVLDCRMSNFERRRIRVDITHEGFLRAIEPIPKTE